MKRLFLSLLALALPFAMLLALAEWRLSRVRWNEYVVKRDLFERAAPRLQVLITGSSHAYRGIEPEEIGEHAFNLAGLSQSLYYDRALIERALKRSPSLKLVIVPVSYFSLEYELDQGIEKWRAYYYRYEYRIPHRNWHMAWNARNYLAWFLGGQQLGRTRILWGRIQDESSRFTDAGGVAALAAAPREPSVGISTISRDSAAAVLQRHHAQMSPSNFEENRRLLAGLIQELKGRGIAVVLVTLPVSRYYADGMDRARYGRMQAALRDLSSAFGVSYLNYTRDSRFLDEDFANPDHLSPAGAVKFSRILRDEVKMGSFGRQPDRARSEPGMAAIAANGSR